MVNVAKVVLTIITEAYDKRYLECGTPFADVHWPDNRNGSCHSFGVPGELFAVSDECDVLLVDETFRPL